LVNKKYENNRYKTNRNFRRLKEALGYPTVTVDNIIWNSEWTDIFSAYRDGRSADYELLPRKVTVSKYKIDAMDEDEIISAISEDLYERFYYYPDSFIVYDTETGDFIAEL